MTATTTTETITTTPAAAASPVILKEEQVAATNDAVTSTPPSSPSKKETAAVVVCTCCDNAAVSPSPLVVGYIARIGMRSLETRTAQGADKSMPRKERQSKGVLLVAPTTNDDDKMATDDNNSHGGLVALPAAASDDASDDDDADAGAAQALKTKAHEEKMIKLEETRRQNVTATSATTAASTPPRKPSASPFSSPTRLKQSLFALGKRLLSSPFSTSKRSRTDDAAAENADEPSSKRRRTEVSSTKQQVYPITHTAKFERVASTVVEAKAAATTESNGDATPAATNGTATNGTTTNGTSATNGATNASTTNTTTTNNEGDYNHYRLSGNAERDKDQHPATRAVSLAAMSVYDEIESFLSSTEGEKVVYGDLGENVLIAGISSLAAADTTGGNNPTQLHVGMRLRFGGAAIVASCPSCGGGVAKKTEGNSDKVADDKDDDTEEKMTTEGTTDDESTTSPASSDTADAPMIEICHINNPCSRLENVPWSQRALTAVGGSMWGHHPTLKKYGWWWSPQMPLNDVVHPGGRGVLCRVVQGGIVREGDAVTLVTTATSSL